MSSLLAAGYNLTSGQFELLSKILYDDTTGDIDADGALTVGTFVQLKDYGGSPPSPSVGGALWAEKPGSNDEIWFYDGTGTVNTRLLDTNYSLAGDVTGAPGSTSVDKIRGYAVEDHAPLDGEVLQWVNANSQYEPATLAAGAHDLGGSSHNADSLFNLNQKVSGGSLDFSTDSRPPFSHDLGGSAHETDSLANLNNKVTGGSLDFSTASRPPNGSASGDLSGTYPGPAVAKIQGYAVQDHAPLDGEALVWINGNSRYEPGIAGPLKISTYTYTLDSDDIKAGEIDITISAVTLTDVRLLDVCVYSPTNILKSYDPAYMAFVLYVVIDSTTNVNVALGGDASVGDIVNLIIGEVIRGEA